MRFIFLVITLLFFIGCSSHGVEYVMPLPQVDTIGEFRTNLGVAEVKIPDYLNSDKIVVQRGTKLTQIDAHFATIPSKMLTHNAIVALKKSLNTPNVFLYPWEFKVTKGYIIVITLDSFIYKDGKAIVAGSYYIKSAQGAMVIAQNFRYSQACKESSREIVVTLSTLFNRVLKDIVIKLARR